uniref:RT07649p n=1 Tax=Drosophila melanogaster TaxID=7227 RepID=D5SHP8_DROME|nr:RT07649p [Drosophila melanogaster]
MIRRTTTRRSNNWATISASSWRIRTMTRRSIPRWPARRPTAAAR